MTNAPCDKALTAGNDAAQPTLVTVIIPAFNAGQTLAATISSVLAQTHTTLQVLVVDDGSTDGTVAIAERFAKTDPRVTALSRPNGGVARARNTGLERAKGTYVAWLDSDDVWHPTKIARQLDVFRTAKVPLSFVYSGYRQIDSDDQILAHHRRLTEVTGFSPSRQIATNFFSNVSSIIAPTDLARQLGGHDPCLRDSGIEGAEDLLLQLRLSLEGPVGCCREALVGYRMHDRNMSLGFKRAAMSNLKVLDMAEDIAPSLPSWVFKTGRARVVGFVPFVIRSGAIGDGMRLFTTILRRQPFATIAMCGRILAHVARDKVFGPAATDPAIGQNFFEADTASAPWQPHMLLSANQQRQLDQVDRNLAATMGELNTA